MSAQETGKAMTANRLGDGAVVYLTRTGDWAESIDDAAVALEPQAAFALEARGKAAEAENMVTGAMLLDVSRVNGRVRAAHIRERIRALGPTVRLDLGKQSAGIGGAFPAAEA